VHVRKGEIEREMRQGRLLIGEKRDKNNVGNKNDDGNENENRKR
jgi:hypothetical protein